MKNDNLKSKNIPSFLKPFYWLYLGVLEFLLVIKDIIMFAFDGIKELVFSFIEMFKLAYVGFRFLILIPFSGAYNFSSRHVDAAYKGAKKILKPDLKTNNEAANVSDSWLSKVWKVLNGNIGGDKKISAKKLAKLEEKRKILQKELASPNTKRATKATIYVYKAKTKGGKWVDGRFIGFSKLDVNAFLLNEGYEVYSIENNKWIDFLYGDSQFSSHRLSNKDLIFWLTQLSTYVKSGIPLTDAVKILMNQMGKNKSKRGIFQSIAYQLTMGEAFSSALEKQGDVFPPLLINMLKAAEATGELEETLDDMANYYSDIEKTRKEMISAITYPAIVTVFAFGVITFILLYVIPKFSDIYTSMDVKVSGLTLFLLNLSAFLQDYIVFIFLGIIGIIILIVYLYKKLKNFRRSLQIFAMKLPIFGNIIIYNEMTIFAKTFASLLKNNVNITESIGILSKITNNEIYREIMVKTIENVASGEKISSAFKDNWAIPDVAYYMIVTGESTGELAEMMSRVSEYYQLQHHSLVANLKSFIEPVMIVFLAVIVGGIILAVIIPMFDMYQQVSMG